MDQAEYLTKCLDYYETFHESYHRRTFFVDPEPFLAPLAELLPPDALVFDVGCSSGRDMLWFKQRGFRVMGLERSASLCRMARLHTDAAIIEADYRDFDFSTVQADAILLIGTLVHVPHPLVPDTLRSIAQGVRNRGFVLLTLKDGQGCQQRDDGRIFYLWDKEAFLRLAEVLSAKTLHYQYSSSLLDNSDAWHTLICRVDDG